MAIKKQRRLGISLERTTIPSSSGGIGGVIWIVFALFLALAVYFSARYWWRSEESPASSEIAQTASPTPAPLPAATASHAPSSSQPPSSTPVPPPAATRIPAPPAASSQPLPPSVTLTKPAQLAIMQGGHVTGYVYLRQGQRLTPAGIEGSNILVSWGEERGVVPISSTDLRR